MLQLIEPLLDLLSTGPDLQRPRCDPGRWRAGGSHRSGRRHPPGPLGSRATSRRRLALCLRKFILRNRCFSCSRLKSGVSYRDASSRGTSLGIRILPGAGLPTSASRSGTRLQDLGFPLPASSKDRRDGNVVHGELVQQAAEARASLITRYASERCKCRWKSLGQGIHGNPPSIGVVDELFGLRVQRLPVACGEQCLIGVLAVEVLDGVAHRFGRTTQAAGDAPAHLGQRAGAHAPGRRAATQNVVLSRPARQLRKRWLPRSTRSLLVSRNGSTSEGKKPTCRRPL